MTAPAVAPASNAGQAGPSALRLVDCDIHQEFASWNELLPHLAPAFRERVGRDGPGLARRGYNNVGGGVMEDMRPEGGGSPAADPAWVKRQLIDRYRIDVGILTGNLIGVGVQPNPDFSAALASAYNDWMLEHWVRPYQCYKGSILIAPQDPEQAAREIHRHGDDPGMVQVIMCSAAQMPYGQRFYHPIYQAAVEHDLPVSIHVGAESVGIARPPTAVGYPTTYLEYHTDHSQTFMAHLVSLVCEGVFEKFPTLKFVFIEGGVCWVPHIMWRLDKNFKAVRAETPWLKRLPSEYILDHCYFTTQPIEEPKNPEHLLQVFAMMDGHRTIVYSSDYPHWDFDNPFTAFSFFPADLKRRIYAESAVDLYGPRLTAPHASA